MNTTDKKEVLDILEYLEKYYIDVFDNFADEHGWRHLERYVLVELRAVIDKLRNEGR